MDTPRPSPGPWRHRRRAGAEYTTVEDAAGEGIASTYRGRQEANAELICRAVNAHAELLAALEALLSSAEINSAPGEKAKTAAGAALAKARGA